MKIIRAEFLGMCFGVRDAIALARKQASQGPVTILGELVHNENVLQDLRKVGVQIETDFSRVNTSRAIVTAHGTSQKTMEKARAHGLDLVEGTCPLVHSAHRAVAAMVKEGCYPVIIGKADHVEVRGITDDLEEYTVVQTEADLEKVPARPKIGVAAQTTQPIGRVRQLVQLLRERLPGCEVRFSDTVCLPTKQRQIAAENMARKVELVIVVGGANSNNTRELAATCAKYCPVVHHVQGPDGLNIEWFKDVKVAGVTAGTSTPDYLLEAVEQRMRELAQQLEENPEPAMAVAAS